MAGSIRSRGIFHFEWDIMKKDNGIKEIIIIADYDWTKNYLY